MTQRRGTAVNLTSDAAISYHHLRHLPSPSPPSPIVISAISFPQTLESRPSGVSNAARLYVCGRSKGAKATKIDEVEDTPKGDRWKPQMSDKARGTLGKTQGQSKKHRAGTDPASLESIAARVDETLALMKKMQPDHKKDMSRVKEEVKELRKAILHCQKDSSTDHSKDGAESESGGRGEHGAESEDGTGSVDGPGSEEDGTESESGDNSEDRDDIEDGDE